MTFRLLVLAAVLVAPRVAHAGAFIFAETNGVNIITHPAGYTGSGGTLNVTTCIDPATPNAASMVTSVQNMVNTWNTRSPASPNLFFGASNDIPAGQVDFESVAIHELGHCIGLAHPNLSSESGLTGDDQNYTKTQTGADGSYDLGIGADGVRGSSDDARDDDVNLHWFRRSDNNPFNSGAVTDTSTYARDLAFLPGGHAFAANADRTVGSLLGFPNTEAVMQQGSFSDEDQRRLAADDVATLELAMSGLDVTEGTADDYTPVLSYVGLTTSCNVVFRFDNSMSSFATCYTGGAFINATHVRVTTANIYFNTGYTWYFNPVSSVPTTTSSTTSTSTSSTTTTSTSTSSTTSSSTSTSSTTSTSSSSTTTTSTSSSSTSTSTSTSTSSSTSTSTSSSSSTSTSSSTTSTSTSSTTSTSTSTSSTTSTTVTTSTSTSASSTTSTSSSTSSTTSTTLPGTTTSTSTTIVTSSTSTSTSTTTPSTTSTSTSTTAPPTSTSSTSTTLASSTTSTTVGTTTSSSTTSSTALTTSTSTSSTTSTSTTASSTTSSTGPTTSTSSTSSTTTSTSTSTSSSSTTTTSTTSSTSTTLVPTTTTTATSTSTSTTVMTTTTTSTTVAGSTTSTTLPGAPCSPAPRPACVEAAKGSLVVDERVVARARLRAVWKALGAFVPTADLGDPVAGGTTYAVCLYDAADTLVGALEIDRAGASCGLPAKPCWKAVGSTGFRYADKNATVHGLRRLVLKGGAAGKGKIALKAKVQPGRSLSGLPPGIPAALAGSGEVTAQIASSDAGCFTLTTNVVSGADGTRFSGRRR